MAKKAAERNHKTLPPYLKRFFVKPKRVVFFDKRNSEMCVGSYIGTIQTECLTAHLGMEVISGSVTLKDFFNHWKYGLNPLKRNWRGQYGTFKNDAEWRRTMTRIFRDIKRAVLGLWWHTGYFHADLHLGNIMIDPKTYKIKIIDFGPRTPSVRRANRVSELVKGEKEPWKDKKLSRSSTGRLGSDPRMRVRRLAIKFHIFQNVERSEGEILCEPP